MLNQKIKKERTISDKKIKDITIKKEKNIIFGKQFEVLTFTNTQFILKR